MAELGFVFDANNPHANTLPQAWGSAPQPQSMPAALPTGAATRPPQSPGAWNAPSAAFTMTAIDGTPFDVQAFERLKASMTPQEQIALPNFFSSMFNNPNRPYNGEPITSYEVLLEAYRAQSNANSAVPLNSVVTDDKEHKRLAREQEREAKRAQQQNDKQARAVEYEQYYQQCRDRKAHIEACKKAWHEACEVRRRVMEEQDMLVQTANINMKEALAAPMPVPPHQR